jgi:hypothetical protein
MNKKGFAAVIFLLFLSADELFAKTLVLERKELSIPVRGSTEINSAELFIDKDNNIFVQINDFLRVNNKWIKTDEYGRCLNGFLKDGQLYMAFEKDGNIDVYKVKKDFELASRIKIVKKPNILWSGSKFERIFPVHGEDNSYFLQGRCGKLPTNPFEFLFIFTSGGHGIFYTKPVLAEVRDGKMLRYLKFRYGGKLDESFIVKEATEGKDSIGFLGLRKLEEPKMGLRHLPQPVILHYAEYNVKKRKVVRTQDIYENIPHVDSNDKPKHLYWHVSADNFNDELFAVFSWHGLRFSKNADRIPDAKMEKADSPIYYSQSNGKGFSGPEIIGNGILPLVRTDSLGNVHVLWTNSEGAIVHKVKKGDKWSDEQPISDDVIDVEEVWESMRWEDKLRLQNMCAQFDRNNNLNIIYSSENKLIYAKVRLD